MAPKCGRCGKTVYHNEETIAFGKSYHKRGCFTCKECNKSLDSTTVSGKEEGDIYFKACYGRLFGPSGYGFGDGASSLTTTGKD